jgi:hypothetical protein
VREFSISFTRSLFQSSLVLRWGHNPEVLIDPDVDLESVSSTIRTYTRREEIKRLVRKRVATR